MKVFKFGGASVNSVERIVRLAAILKQFSKEKILVVISAMGKTTNSLEKVTQAFYAGKNDEALALFGQVKQDHLSTARQLLTSHYEACEEQLARFFTEAEWLLHEKPQHSLTTNRYDYYYDQLVCIGELLSTSVVSFYLNEINIRNLWFDVRDIIRTDDNFRDANISWEFTQVRVSEAVLPLFSEQDLLITQGFIGATDENESTTLGREGSDYTAAVFANMLNAESQTIWKDVENVMNADPKQFPDAQPIPELNYNEVIEMAYYGAQVIHPKTIKPLQNKDIPLYVKCFLDPSLKGTVIHDNPVHDLPPILVIKEKQVLLEMSSKDFSFVGEHHVSSLYDLFGKIKIKPNLTQNTAISFIAVFDDIEDKIEKLALAVTDIFDVQTVKDLVLVTIRHYNSEIVERFSRDKIILLRQQTVNTIQLLMRQ